MHTRTALLFLCVVIGASVSGGCNGNHVPLEDFFDEFSHAACSSIMRCCTLEEIHERNEEISSMEDCVAYMTADNQWIRDAMLSSHENGEFAFDSGQAGSCLDKLENSSCWFDYIGCFDGIIKPRMKPGETCLGPTSCIDGTCVYSDGPEEPGTCVAFSVNGEPCKDPDYCAEGFYCKCPDGTTSCWGSTDIQGTCVPQLDLGQPCENWYECLGDLYCSPNNVCEEESAEGEMCGNGFTCASGLECNNDIGVCERYCSRAIPEIGCLTSDVGSTLPAFIILLVLAYLCFHRRKEI